MKALTILLAGLASVLAFGQGQGSGQHAPPVTLGVGDARYLNVIKPVGLNDDGVTDNTTAIQTAITAAGMVGLPLTPGGGVVALPQPRPSHSFRVNSTLTVPPGVTVLGPGGTIYNPTITFYGAATGPLFSVSGASSVRITGISAAFGATTTIGTDASVGASAIALTSSAGMAVGDLLVFGTAAGAGHETFKVYSISGNTVGLATTGGIATTGGGVGSLATTTSAFAHPAGEGVVWIPAYTGSFHGKPNRDYFGVFAYVENSSHCSVDHCAVTGWNEFVHLRGQYLSNSNDSDNSLSDNVCDFCTQGYLSEQQDNLVEAGRLVFNRILYSQDGHTTGAGSAPAHAEYDSGSIALSSAYNAGTTYAVGTHASEGSVEYISQIDGNIGNDPASTPADWAAQASYKTVCNNITKSGSEYVNGGESGNDCSANKDKFTHGMTDTRSKVLVNCPRDEDFEQVWHATVSCPTVPYMLASFSTDSQAACEDILDCLDFHLLPGVINCMSATGAAIDIPAVLIRTDGTSVFTATNATNAAPIQVTASQSNILTGQEVYVAGVVGNTAANGYFIATNVDASNVTLQGSTGNGAYTSGGVIANTGNVSITGVKAYTNYDSSMSQGAFRITGCPRSGFSECQWHDVGGASTPIGFQFAYNATQGISPDGAYMQAPTAFAGALTTSLATVATSCTNVALSWDTSLVPTTMTYTDSGTNTQITSNVAPKYGYTNGPGNGATLSGGNIYGIANSQTGFAYTISGSKGQIIWLFWKQGSSSNKSVTLTPANAGQINGASSLVYNSAGPLTLMNDGSNNWFTVAASPSIVTLSTTSAVTLYGGIYYTIASGASTATLTFDNPANWVGQEVTLKWTYNTDTTKSVTLAYGSANVENFSGTLASSITWTSATGIAKYARFRSDGTNWRIVASN